MAQKSLEEQEEELLAEFKAKQAALHFAAQTTNPTLTTADGTILISGVSDLILQGEQGAKEVSLRGLDTGLDELKTFTTETVGESVEALNESMAILGRQTRPGPYHCSNRCWRWLCPRFSARTDQL